MDMMKEGKLPYNTVVTTVMANIGFHQAIKKAGGRAEITKVGDRYVLENMLKNGYKIGGEQSGHIIFTDFSTTGDGLITALQVLSSLKRSGRKASDLTALMTTYPQLLVNVKRAGRRTRPSKRPSPKATRSSVRTAASSCARPARSR